MSYTPPDPGIQQSFLDLFASTTYDPDEQAVRSAAGALLRPVLAAGANPGTVVWGLETPANCISCRLTSATYAILSGGTLLSDGRVSYGGHTYRLRALRTMSGGSYAVAVAA